LYIFEQKKFFQYYVNKENLLSKFEPERIILFGSQARGSADSRSDVDIVVISKNITDRYKLIREISRSLLSLNFGFDIIALTIEEYERDRFILCTVSRYASTEGIIIYES
jgi:predicted nucleotidyltransferase